MDFCKRAKEKQPVIEEKGSEEGAGKMWKLIKKPKRCVWWVIIGKIGRENASLF